MTRVRRACLLLLLGCAGCSPSEGGRCRVEHSARCEGERGALVCSSGRWALRPCLGVRGCGKEGYTLRCDDSVSEPNAPCEPSGNSACTADGKSQLLCDRGRYALVGRCRGPRACSVAPGRVLCDNAGGVQGDECPYEGTFSCGAGGQLVLVCRAGRLDVATTCVSGRCVIETGVARCK